MNTSEGSATPTNRYQSLFLLLVVAATGLCYGAVFSRGGFGDDFEFIAHAQNQPLLQAIGSWGYNSRWTWAVLTPIVLSAIDQAAPGQAAWWAMHAAALGLLVALVVGFERSLALLGVARPVRYVSAAVFLLHPAKAQVLFWPSSLFGYLLPAAIVAAAFWYHLSIAKADRETWPRLLIVLAAYLIAALAIEQFVPFCLVLIGIRVLALPATRRQWSRSAILGSAFIAIFTASATVGGTSARLAHHGGMSPGLVLEQAPSVLRTLFDVAVLSPFQVFLDADYSGYLASALFGWRSAALMLILGIVMVIAYRRRGQAVVGPEEQLRAPGLGVFAAGLALAVAPLLPLMVVRYYVPERVIFLPLLGVSLLLGALYAVLVRGRILRRLVQTAAVLGILVLGIASIARESQFAHYWEATAGMISGLAADTRASDVRTVAVYGFPRALDPVPTLDEKLLFRGLVRWLESGRPLDAELNGDFEAAAPDFCAVPTSAITRPVRPGTSAYVFVPPARLHHFDGIRVARETTATPELRFDGTLLTGTMDDRRFENSYGGAVRLGIGPLVMLPGIDALVICTRVTGASKGQRLRTVLHAVERDGTKSLYDRDVTVAAGSTPVGGEMRHAFIVHRASSVTELKVALRGAGVGSSIATPQLQPGKIGSPRLVFF